MAKTLAELGSEDLYETIIKDLNDLMQSASDTGYIPIQLVVGRLFVEMSCCRTIISDLDISDWGLLCRSKFSDLTAMLNERVLEVLNSLIDKGGFLGDKETVDIFYNPDESYMSLYAIFPDKKDMSPGEFTTGDGYPIRKLRFKEEDLRPKDFLH